MTKGVRDLRQIQIGFQGVDLCGTPATPTDRIVGICGMKKLVNRVFPMEATGVMEDHVINRYYDPWIMAELPITPGEEGLTFQQFPWFLSMGVEGGVTGLGGPPAYTWTFQPAWATADTPDPATIRYGDNARVWEATCCFARQLVISAAFQGQWQIEADIIGRDMATSAFEVIAYPTPLQTILGQLTRYYSEATCIGIHDTPTHVAGSMIDWSVTIPGFHPKFFQDGQLTYSLEGLDSRHLDFTATIEFDTDHATIEWDAWVNATPRYVRLQALGTALGGTYYTAQIDMNIMYESFETIDERDGNDIVEFTARTVYDVNCSDCEAWQIVVINNDAALP